MLKLFIAPVVISVAALGAVYLWGGAAALSVAIFLSLLEISLSFDNAVVNARVLEKMTVQWPRRFLPWGVLVAVFGSRLILPASIVAIASGMSPWAAGLLAFYNPAHYSEILAAARPIIDSFGGAFLLMVALRYFFDEAKDVHWIHFIESRLIKLGRISSIEVTITLLVLLVCAWFLPGDGYAVLGAGCVGIALFVMMEGITDLLDISAARTLRGGITLFVYLNLIDATFSLDGVIGAFALTTLLPVILVGLGIGAYFVRTLTFIFVRQHTLRTLMYLEHGAYWAISALAFCLFAGLFVEVPDAVAGSISILFIGSAYLSSLRARRHVV
mgnify:CR=1 FL=1